MPGVDAGLRLGRLRAERDAVLAAMPTDPDSALLELIQEQRALTRHLDELRSGTGRYTNTPIGQAAQDRVAAQAAYDQAARHARSSVLSRRQERKANVLVEKRETELDQTRQAWLSTGAPIEQELTAQFAATEDAKAQLGIQRYEREAWLLQHPDTLDRLAALKRETQRLELDAGIVKPDRPDVPIPPPALGGPGLAM
jgi:hypothetical protein